MQNSQANKGATLSWKWNGKAYKLPVTREDVLTLARAVDEEGFPHDGVAWTLLQRAAWLQSRGIKVSLGRLVQQYAQPINPLWFPTGEKHLAEIERLTRLNDNVGIAAERKRAVTRIAKSQKSWDAMSAETKKVIEGILSGKSVSPVKGAVHYWASRAPDFAGNQAKKPNLVLLDRGYGFGAGRNVFFAEKGSEAFGDIKILGGMGLNPGALIATAFAGYLAWKWLS